MIPGNEDEDEVEDTRKKNKTKTPPHLPWSFSVIPDEIVLSCFARVSKSDYASLSVVCKSFRSLLTSPELYVGRRGTNEICFYVCLHVPTHPSPRWFSLWVKPKSSPNRNLLVPIMSDSLPVTNSTVAVGPEIYALGGTVSLSSSVRIFDCRKHTWRDGPNMTVARRNAIAFVRGHKIYVMGGCSVDDEWSEVFDTKTHTWKPLSLTTPEEKKFVCQIKENPRIFDLCQWWWLVDKVMYCYTNTGEFMWYDSVPKTWRYVNGLQGLVNTSGCRMIQTVNCGGKIALFYECSGRTSPNKEFWCVLVYMERPFGNHVYGRILWVNLMLTVPKSYDFLRSLAISI